MRAVVMLLQSQVRRHWRSWLALATLAMLAGGVVIAAVSTARRTAAAFPDFVARHGYDAVVYSAHPLPSLASIQRVALVTAAPGPVNFPGRCDTCRKQIDAGSFALFEMSRGGLARTVKLLAGRMPDQSRPGEVLASYTLASDNGVRIGTVIQVLTPTRAQFKAYAAVVNPHAKLLSVYYVRLRRGAADLPGFDAALRPLHTLGADDLDDDAAAIQRGIRPQAAGWSALALLAALAGLAVIGQAAARQFVTDADHRQALSALGLGVRQFVALGLARAAVIGALGAAGAVALAALLSPLTPVGEARLASGSPGAVAIDPLVTATGALATMVAVVALSLWPAVRNARQLRGSPQRPLAVPVISAVARSGAPPTATIGIRYALERGRGKLAVPVGAALLGSVMAVAALCGTAVFGASLAQLLSSPALFGAPFQAAFTNEGIGTGSAVTHSLLTSLRRDQAIRRITQAAVVEIGVNNHHVRAVAVKAIRGPALISTVDGRLPRGDRDIMLGAATMRAVGASPGGTVSVTIPDPMTGAVRKLSFRVTGRAAFPPSFGTGGFGSGAALTLRGFTDALCPPGGRPPSCESKADQELIYEVLVRAAPGHAGIAALARYTGPASRYRQFVAFAEEPIELVNFGESVNFPLLFGGLLALFGAATMVHLLLVSVTRRRTEAGLLKVLGFVRRQVAAVVGWQATTVALVGVVVGVPLGIATGRVAWRVFATNFGVVPVSAVPAVALTALVAGVLVIANVLAVAPALLAARSRPAQLLRAE